MNWKLTRNNNDDHNDSNNEMDRLIDLTVQ